MDSLARLFRSVKFGQRTHLSTGTDSSCLANTSKDGKSDEGEEGLHDVLKAGMLWRGVEWETDLANTSVEGELKYGRRRRKFCPVCLMRTVVGET